MEDVKAPPLKPPLRKTSAPRDQEPDDVDKILKWQEERLARKLRGQYESAVMHLAEVVNSNLNTPLNISAVRVEGAGHTRSSFLGFLINPILNANQKTHSDLESVLHTTRRISHILQKSEVFSHVDAKIDRARDVLAGDGDVDLVFKTRERGRLYLNTSTELGNNEGSAAATGRIRNVFGGAETLEAHVAFGTKTRKSFRVSLTAPITPSLNTFGELAIYGMEKDNTSFASCMEGLRGLRAVVRTGANNSGAHEVAYEAVLRHIAGLTPTASISIRESAGQTSKSSISHTYTIDTRDDRLMTTRGYYAKLSNEYAGLGGDASFYKMELEGQISRPIAKGISLSLAARSGLLWGISKPTLFSDRFQLGGPTSIRSFRANSMGPRDGSDSLGGDIHWSGGVSMISDIPNRPHWPVKSHIWVNVGRLDALDQSQSLISNVRSTLSRPSVSAGFGLIYRFDPIRVEVNFGVPLVASKSDGARKGLQVGMGLEFL